MRKIVIPKPGGYDRLVIEQHPDPQPGPGEVLLEVEAIGINYADCVTRMGLYDSAKEFVGYPITPGFEVAGRVKAVGEGVSDLQEGTPVLGVTLFGAYATQLVLPHRQVFTIPDGMSMEQAGGFPTIFLTAWFALFELAHPRPGSSMLVHSAAGGVGSALVQLGKLAGCRVVGVVGRPEKREAVLALGAEAVIDKSSCELWAEAGRLAPEGYDLVLDANGVETLMQSYRHLAPVGRLVVYGFHSMLPRGVGRANLLKLLWHWWRTPRFDPLRMTNRNRSVLAFNLSFLFAKQELLREGLEQLLQWYREGRIQMPRVTGYPFEEVARAHRDLESGGTIGKLVLTTGER